MQNKRSASDHAQREARSNQHVGDERIDRVRAEIHRERQMMGQAIGVFDQGLLADLQLVGYTAETIVLVELAPLVQIAWADGHASKRQRDAIFQIAAREHVRDETPAHIRLEAWLERCPPDDVFDISLSAIQAKLEGLQIEARGALQRRFISECRAVALAADNVLGDHKIAMDEGRVLAKILVSLKPGRLVR